MLDVGVTGLPEDVFRKEFSSAAEEVPAAFLLCCSAPSSGAYSQRPGWSGSYMPGK